ncbi:MAG: anaerobic ribonucleoside-triphosphate reductase activating protein [Clostridiales bacterium]|nr:anaerobic ribonucleoside-triphosphate reductase activating protein [Clostridiales bacterium]
MKFGGLQKLTLLDYPEHVACTLFTIGCNLRCPFCHNFSLVVGNLAKLEQITEEDALAFLRKRSKVLEGVCITGGEPLMQAGIKQFIEQVKQMGYSVKLDTNGAYPNKLRELVECNLIDYVAMDIKNSRELYNKTCGCVVEMEDICSSVEYLKSGVVDYEFRTTVTGTFHSDSSIEQAAKWLQGAKRWYLQQFVDSGELIDSTVVGVDVETLKRYQKIAEQYVPNTQLRGVK